MDIGLSTTPTVELAVAWEKAAGGIIFTASHNPAQWNALKLLNSKGEFISDLDGKALLNIAEKNEFEFVAYDKMGKIEIVEDYFQKHIDHVLELELVDVEAIRSSNFKIIVDAVNSSGGIVMPRLLKALGVEEVSVLFGEPTGYFAHNPEPLPENLTTIISMIQKHDFDLGVVVDPDVDRLCFISEDGTPFGEEYTLVAVADYILENKKGNTVSNLSSTRALRDVTEKHGGEYFAAAVGEVNVVTQMKDKNAIIGGEGNGGVIYPDSHYGRDALVGVGLFLTALAKKKMKCSEYRSTFPNYIISKNKIELTPSIDIDELLSAVAKEYSHENVNTIDGVKVDFANGWVHLRKSNTEPIIRIYAEASTEKEANGFAQKIIDFVNKQIA
jgi:phosphomannomutase